LKRRYVALATVAGALLAISAYAAYDLGSGDALSLQACVEVYPRPAGWICEKSLFWFHPTAAEVEEMNRSAGALIVLSVSDKEFGRRLLKHFLGAGLDINARDQRTQSKWTALHGAAAGPNVEEVKILLAHGADPSIKDAAGMTPLDRAKRAQEKFPSPRQVEVVRLLEQAMQPASKP